MSLTHKDMIAYLLERYTQEELATILDTSTRSIDNYQKGRTPSKKTKEIIHETYEKISANNGKKVPVKDIKVRFEADPNKLISEMIEQTVAITATQNILKPIIYELYATHRSEMLTKTVNELDNLIASEAKRLLEIIQRKWKP
jgi:transcriptional regulator with XRE-family HTH domain